MECPMQYPYGTYDSGSYHLGASNYGCCSHCCKCQNLSKCIEAESTVVDPNYTAAKKYMGADDNNLDESKYLV